MTSLLVLATSLLVGPLEAGPAPEPAAIGDQSYDDGDIVIYRRIPGRLHIRIPRARHYRIDHGKAWRDALRLRLGDRIRDSVRIGKLRREMRDNIRKEFRRPIIIRRYRVGEAI